MPMTGFEFHMILVEWTNKTPYRTFKDSADRTMLVMTQEEYRRLVEAIREKVEIPKREAWLKARTAYNGELAAEGKQDYQIADAVDLDDLQQVRLLMMTAQERERERT
jgi:hypothetical protein